MSELERRFTDQEVARILHRAAELEERRPAVMTGAVRGLTLRELHEIGREVGLAPEVLDEAIRALQVSSRAASASALGAPLASKQVWGIPGRLEPEALDRLFRSLEEQVDLTGTLSEALGTVRWTSVSRHKFERTLQVSVSAGDRGTQIQVVQRHPGALRAVLHALPGAWGAMAGVIVVGAAGLGLGAGLAVVGAGAALGVGIGRGIWQALARARERDVRRVAGELAAEASQLARPG